jgi:hypothetical protein
VVAEVADESMVVNFHVGLVARNKGSPSGFEIIGAGVDPPVHIPPLLMVVKNQVVKPC